VLANYSFAISTTFWVGFYYFPGRLARTEIYPVPIKVHLNQHRTGHGSLRFLNPDVKRVFVAMPFEFLMMLLLYLTTTCRSYRTAQARQYPLKEPAGFYWDFFLMGCTCFVGVILSVPLLNGLVPQALVHTDSLTVYETRFKIMETKDGGETRRPVVEVTAAVEQRMSQFLMGMSIWGSMTEPLLIIVHSILAAVFADVFSVIGVSALCFLHLPSVMT
jgi:hypothetical protein